MMPYAQKLVSDYLRDGLTDTRVVSKPPPEDSRDARWVQVIQLPADHNENDPTDRVIAFYFQFSCYAGAEGGLPEAERLVRRVSELLIAMPGSHDAPTPQDDPVVVTGVQLTNGPGSLPDNDGFEPARDRYITDATIWAHSVSR
jgi:hypothetical protein